MFLFVNKMQQSETMFGFYKFKEEKVRDEKKKEKKKF